VVDYNVVDKVEQFGYPKSFIIRSVEQFEMNDAATCYYLLEKEDKFQNNHYIEWLKDDMCLISNIFLSYMEETM
jgi:hypothetical protein